MPDEKSLFAEKKLQSKILEGLEGNGPERLSIAYVGPVLEKGRMDAILLADGLKGTARFINRVAEMHLGTPNDFVLEVEGEPRAGSLEVFIRFSHSVVEFVDWLGSSKFLAGLAIIATLTGFNPKDGGKSLLSIFKKLKGRFISDAIDIEAALPADLPIDKTELIRIYNDPEVQAAIRAAIRPLRKEGVEKYETRFDGRPVESVAKADVEAADAAEMESIISDEEKVLDIEKASFVPHLAWHFSDQGKSFDARIDDPVLWKEVEAGNRFGYGDRLHVTLHTEAMRESNGRLKLTRTIPKVHKIERRGEDQTSLFVA